MSSEKKTKSRKAKRAADKEKRRQQSAMDLSADEKTDAAVDDDDDDDTDLDRSKAKGALAERWKEDDEELQYLRTDPEAKDWREQNAKYANRSVTAALMKLGATVRNPERKLVSAEEHEQTHPCVVHRPTPDQSIDLLAAFHDKSMAKLKPCEPFCNSKEDRQALYADKNCIDKIEECLVAHSEKADTQLVSLISKLSVLASCKVDDTAIGKELELHLWQLMDTTVYLAVYLSSTGKILFKYLRCSCKP